jgi:hypothetical protein
VMVEPVLGDIGVDARVAVSYYRKSEDEEQTQRDCCEGRGEKEAPVFFKK